MVIRSYPVVAHGSDKVHSFLFVLKQCVNVCQIDPFCVAYHTSHIDSIKNNQSKLIYRYSLSLSDDLSLIIHSRRSRKSFVLWQQIVIVVEAILVVMMFLGLILWWQDAREHVVVTTVAVASRADGFQLKRRGKHGVEVRVSRGLLIETASTGRAEGVLQASQARDGLDVVLSSMECEITVLDSDQMHGRHATSATTGTAVTEGVERDGSGDGETDRSTETLSRLLDTFGSAVVVVVVFRRHRTLIDRANVKGCTKRQRRCPSRMIDYFFVLGRTGWILM